jgi:SAM-dependent methyltransferase
MTKLSIEELEKTAEAYEQLLVPAVFEECAHHLIKATDVQPQWHILDVACGTGIVTRAVADRLASEGSVMGVDINPGMLMVARQISPDIQWHEASVEALPFDDDTFDVVLSQFALMFFPDPEAALREMIRVLKPRGRLAVSVFDGIDRQPLYGGTADVYERIIGKSAGDAGRGPFTMGDTDELTSLFAAAGIRTVEVTTCQPKVRFQCARDLVLAEVEGWFPLAQIDVDERTIEAVVDEVDRLVDSFRTTDGTIEAPIPIHIVTATKAS